MHGYRHRTSTLALVLGALTAFAPLSIDMYLPSLPSIQRELGTTAANTQLTLASFFAGLGVAQLAYGPLADRFGRKPPLYVGLVLYVLASLGCGVAPSIETLIVLRFVQASGGAAGIVIARAVVRDRYEGREVARMLSLLMLVMGAAPILAPMIGAAVLQVASFRWIFYLLAAFGALCLLLVFAFLPETLAVRSTSIDVPTLNREIRALLRDRAFVTFTLTGAFSQAGMFAYIATSPFVFIELFRVSPQQYGWFFGANAFGLIASSQINRRLVATRRPSILLRRASFVSAAAGTLLTVLALLGSPSLPLVASSLFLFVASLGFVNPNAVALAMDAQGSRAGLASALLGSVQFAVSAVVASLASASNDGRFVTMRPMAFSMSACAILAAFLAWKSPVSDEE